MPFVTFSSANEICSPRTTNDKALILVGIDWWTGLFFFFLRGGWGRLKFLHGFPISGEDVKGGGDVEWSPSMLHDVRLSAVTTVRAGLDYTNLDRQNSQARNLSEPQPAGSDKITHAHTRTHSLASLLLLLSRWHDQQLELAQEMSFFFSSSCSFFTCRSSSCPTWTSWSKLSETLFLNPLSDLYRKGVKRHYTLRRRL